MINKSKKIYLDSAATPPVADEVLKVMRAYERQKFGNAASLHSFGREARIGLEKARKSLAGILNAEEKEIIFTGSASESNNLALKGYALANKTRGKKIIISAIEHDCVRQSAAWLKKQGFEIVELPVDSKGLVSTRDLETAIKPGTILVSIIHANNEIGTIQDLVAMGRICKKHGVCLHTDAAQSFGKIKIDVKKLGIGMLTASAHKIYGPQGVALLYKRQDIRLEPLIHGGGQEFGWRSGSVNVAGAVGMAKAAEMAVAEMDEEGTRQKELRDYFIARALKEIKGCHLSGHPTKRLANNINLRFEGIEGEALIMRLDAAGVAASTGSACSSEKLQASQILLALGLPHKDVHGSLRISLGRATTKKNLHETLIILKKSVADLRRISPFKLK